MAILAARPNLAVAILKQGAHLVAERLVGELLGHHQLEAVAQEGDLLYPLGVGAEPEVTLGVGEAGVDLVRETPFAASEAVEEGAELALGAVVVGEASTVGVNPEGAIDIFMGMEGGA